jgi:hypothetical protein
LPFYNKSIPPPGDLTGNGQVAKDIDSDGLYEDINGDGNANLRDLQPFFATVRPSTPTPSTMPLDFNGDGTVDLRDLQPFSLRFGRNKMCYLLQ